MHKKRGRHYENNITKKRAKCLQEEGSIIERILAVELNESQLLLGIWTPTMEPPACITRAGVAIEQLR